ncbi:outer membrane protein assembly factor BamE domain-containing protein [Sphingomonas endophytica]|uniref:outer membrane protein assembly factor BamE domain-containing protein n=1 Tax=Sphingomonas endophytica TaxID=869719 RepID=UPI003D159018
MQCSCEHPSMRALNLATLLVAGCSPGVTFDQAKWRSADLTGRDRADMLPDFLARHVLKGMPRQQVVALLGPPTTTDKWRGADMIYVLGNDGSMFPIDNEWLFIKLDRHGRVASFERGTD